MKIPIETLIDEFKLVVTEHNEFEDRDKTFLIAVFDIWDNQVFDVRIKKNDFLLERFSSSAIQLRRWLKRTKPWLLRNMSQIFEKNQLWKQFWNFLTTRILMKGSKDSSSVE